jgi:hypothetical protein
MAGKCYMHLRRRRVASSPGARFDWPCRRAEIQGLISDAAETAKYVGLLRNPIWNVNCGTRVGFCAVHNTLWLRSHPAVCRRIREQPVDLE